MSYLLLFALFACGVSVSSSQLVPVATAYTLAQQVRLLSSDTLVVGRWDSTWEVFRLTVANGYPELGLIASGRSRSGMGIQMVTRLDDDSFVVSDGTGSMTVVPSIFPIRLSYPDSVGVANSGVSIGQWLVTGHENGHVLVWSRLPIPNFFYLCAIVNVTSPNPIPSPFGLRNIRAIVPAGPSHVITGSEDGDVVILSLPDGEIVHRQRYNENASLGINDLAVSGDLLMVVNCAVGQQDKNTWLYRFGLDPPHITLLDSVNLVEDTSRLQVFNFNGRLASVGGVVYFFCGTEEGILWTGKVVDDMLVPLGKTDVSCAFGPAVDSMVLEDRAVIGVSGTYVHLFEVFP